MSDDPSPLDDALERVVAAAREHLAAVRAAAGGLDDERVWDSYVTLNNASYAYDQLLLDEYGEVTPWDTEAIDTSRAQQLSTQAGPPLRERRPADPYPAVVSVRQRRDYRVPSVSALLATARDAASRMAQGGEVAPPESVGEAVLELVRDADNSLAGLDGPELEPVGGVVGVVELPAPLGGSGGGTDLADLFQVAGDGRLVARMDEQPEPAADPAGPDASGPAG